MVRKKESLQKLREKIIRQIFIKGWEDVWFFPEYARASGYLGTGKVLFVGLNPSYGFFPSNADKFFYTLLLRYGFKKAHLTDIIKEKIRNKDVNNFLEKKNKLSYYKKILMEEMRILKPKIVVALGNKTYSLLKELNLSEKIEKINHYSYAYRYNKKQKFRRQLKKLMKT